MVSGPDTSLTVFPWQLLYLSKTGTMGSDIVLRGMTWFLGTHTCEPFDHNSVRLGTTALTDNGHEKQSSIKFNINDQNVS